MALKGRDPTRSKIVINKIIEQVNMFQTDTSRNEVYAKDCKICMDGSQNQ
jgi:hypothetical protein